jgi:CheY-like chemotaxis protein
LRQAYRRAWDFHPDIVITDLTLRGADGWQLIQDLKRKPRTRAIPVVVLTGYAAPSLRERARQEGCAGFFGSLVYPMNLRPDFGTYSIAPLFMKAIARSSEGDTRPCPQCPNTMVFEKPPIRIRGRHGAGAVRV